MKTTKQQAADALANQTRALLVWADEMLTNGKTPTFDQPSETRAALAAYEAAVAADAVQPEKPGAGEDLFGFAPFRKWFDAIWPEPKKRSGKYGNWKYKMEMAWQGWLANEKFAESKAHEEAVTGDHNLMKEEAKPGDWMRAAREDIVELFDILEEGDNFVNIDKIIAKHAPATQRSPKTRDKYENKTHQNLGM